MDSLTKFKRNYSVYGHTKDLLLQFNIAEKIAEQWKFLSNMELEWVWYDVKAEYKKQISKIHPDRTDGDLTQTQRLTEIYRELKLRFNKRLNPPPFIVPVYYQVDNDGNECSQIDNDGNATKFFRKNEIINAICRFCSNPFTYNSSETSIRAFCKDECLKLSNAARTRANTLKKHPLIKKICARPDCGIEFETTWPHKIFCNGKCGAKVSSKNFKLKKRLSSSLSL